MSLKFLCNRVKRAATKPVDSKAIEKKVREAVAEGAVKESINNIKKELLKIAPNPYDRGSYYYSYYSQESTGYNRAMDELARALLEEIRDA